MKLSSGVICAVLAAAGARAQTSQTPVILISIDTLRADHVSAYGNTKIRTPNIDSLAEHGTVFTQADSQVPLTLPSHTSVMTSTYPFENRIEENGERVPQGTVTLASVLRSHGYKTAAFIGSVFLERQMGLDQGFDFYDSPFDSAAAKPGPIPAARERRDGALVIRAARQWLSANKGQPVFAFVHLFDMHQPYPAGYDAQLKYVDRLIGGFRQSLMQMGLWDRALVILMADHGEGLGDHGEASHGYFVYRSTVHVPLIFHWPSEAGAGDRTAALPARVDEPVGLIDIAPTILDILHLPAPPSFEGASLLVAPRDPVYAESVHASDAFGWAPLRSILAGRYQFIEAPKPELYDVQSDPAELKNLYAQETERGDDLRGQLRQLVERHTPKEPVATPEIPSSTRALLDSLGYLAPGPHAASGNSEEAAPDPKDRLDEFRLYEDAWVQIYYGRLERGIEKLGKLLASDPHNLLARRDLAGAYLSARDYAAARAAYRVVLAAAPDDYVAQYGAGVVDDRLGLLPRAKAHLEVACRIEPGSEEARHELNVVIATMN